MYSYGPLHMAEQRQGYQLEPTYSSSVKIRGVAPRTCRKRRTIGRGGERGPGISVLMARQDDDEMKNSELNFNQLYLVRVQLVRLLRVISGHSLEQSYISAEMHLFYSTVPAYVLRRRNCFCSNNALKIRKPYFARSIAP